MSLVNNISARKLSRRQVGGPAQPLRAGVGERKWVGGGTLWSMLPDLLQISPFLGVPSGSSVHTLYPVRCLRIFFVWRGRSGLDFPHLVWR
jgi:hypothetical protein